jgi:hypothetical protein
VRERPAMTLLRLLVVLDAGADVPCSPLRRPGGRRGTLAACRLKFLHFRAMLFSTKATFTWVDSVRPVLVGPVDNRLPTPLFSPFQRAFVPLGLPARSLEYRLYGAPHPRADVSKLRAAGGNPRSTVRRIALLTPRSRAGL